MYTKEKMKCSKCGGKLIKYGNVKRIVREGNGRKRWIFAQKCMCLSCRHVIRLCPDILFPKKHYRKDIIQGFRNGRLSSNDILYEDLPCETTIRRWRQMDIL